MNVYIVKNDSVAYIMKANTEKELHEKLFYTQYKKNPNLEPELKIKWMNELLKDFTITELNTWNDGVCNLSIGIEYTDYDEYRLELSE